MEMKVCAKCTQRKPATDEYFYKRGDGLRAVCKECDRDRFKRYREANLEIVKKRSKQYYEAHREQRKQYREANSERTKKYLKQWHKTNIEKCKQYREANSEYYKQWRKANRERIKEQQKLYREANREKIMKKQKQWNEANPEKNREKARRYKAQKINASIGEVCYKTILERDGYVCHLCNGPVEKDDVHFDHVIPVSRGGAHSMENIKVAHSYCNRSKHAKLPHEWQEHIVNKGGVIQ